MGPHRALWGPIGPHGAHSWRRQGPGPIIVALYFFFRQHLKKNTNFGSKNWSKKSRDGALGPLPRARDRNSVQNAGTNASRSFFSTHFVKIWGHFGWIGVPGPACTVLGPGPGTKGPGPRALGQGTRAQGPGTRDQGPGPGTRDQGPGPFCLVQFGNLIKILGARF